MSAQTTPAPTDLIVHGASRVLEISFADGRSFRLPFELMRIYSPSAEVQGHGPGQAVLVTGKQVYAIGYGRTQRVVAAAAAEGVDLSTPEGEERFAQLLAGFEVECKEQGERVRELGGLDPELPEASGRLRCSPLLRPDERGRDPLQRHAAIERQRVAA